MLIEEPKVERPDVIIAIEDDRAFADGVRSLKRLRESGFSAEMIATGSPRKRFDKAAKVGAKVLIAFTWQAGKATANLRSVPGTEEHAQIEQLLKGLAAQ
jgi:histidyl-tRNA synthetase